MSKDGTMRTPPVPRDILAVPKEHPGCEQQPPTHTKAWKRATAAVSSVLFVSSAVLGMSTPATSATTTLHVLLWTNPPAVLAAQQISAAFEKAHPTVHVVVESANAQTSAFSTMVTSALASRTVDVLAQEATVPPLQPPAKTHIPASGTYALQLSGQMVNLANQPFMKLYNHSWQEFSSGINGNIYALEAAEYAEEGNVIAKTALLQKYHVAIPTTYNALLQDCALFKTHGITCFFDSGEGEQSFLYDGVLIDMLLAGKPASDAISAMYNMSEEFYAGTLNWNSSIFVKAAQEYETLLKYTEAGMSGITLQEAPGDWAPVTNNYPFLLGGTWAIPSVLAINPKLAITDFMLPLTNTPSDNHELLKDDLQWMIPKNSPNVAVAEQWLDFFSQPSNYATWIKATGSFSLEPALFNKAPYLSWENSHIGNAAFGTSAIDPWVPPSAPEPAFGPTQFSNGVLEDMVPVGSTSIAAELSQCAAAYTSILKTMK
jgi:raffinose/stachyose/melibiose transport system substrate-binding protein